MKNLLLSFLVLMLFAVTGFAQSSPFGIWKSVDDESGEAKSYIELYEAEGLMYGKIKKLLQAEQDATCDACKGNKKGKPLLGMEVVTALTKNGKEWEGGKIMDPETGKTYKCKIWVDESNPDRLNVRGIHWTGIYRTQQWVKVKE